MAFKVSPDKISKEIEKKIEEEAKYAQFGRPIVFWTCRAGMNKVRFLPPWTDKGPHAFQYFRESYVHFNVTAKEVLDDSAKFFVACVEHSPNASELLKLPAGSKPRCPICEFSAELISNTDDPFSVERGNSIRAKRQYASNIIDLADPIWTQQAVQEKKAKGTKDENLPSVGSPKVQLYNYGVTIRNDLLSYYQDNIDFCDIDHGYDVKIERTGTGMTTKYSARLEMKSTPAPIKDKELDTLLYNLDDVSPFLSVEQMEAILGGATRDEVWKLSDKNKKSLPAAEKPKQIESKKEVKPEPEIEFEETVEVVEEVDADTGVVTYPFLDAEGDIDFNKLTDEDIENEAFDQYKIKAGTDEEQTPYIDCFGAARIRDVNDENCTACGLFERCGKRIEFLDAPKPVAVAKKKPGRPAAAKETSVAVMDSAPAPKVEKPVEKPSIDPQSAQAKLEAMMKAKLAAFKK